MRIHGLITAFLLLAACKNEAVNATLQDASVPRDMNTTPRDMSTTPRDMSTTTATDGATSTDGIVVATTDGGSSMLGESCGDAHLVTSATSGVIASGLIQDFSRAADAEDVDCTYHGPDAFFEYVATSVGYYTFDTAGSVNDTVLFVHRGSCSAVTADGECNDDRDCPANDDDYSSLLTVPLSAGEHVFVRVGSYDARNPVPDGGVADSGTPVTGSFTVTVSFSATEPTPPSCDDEG